MTSPSHSSGLRWALECNRLIFVSYFPILGSDSPAIIATKQRRLPRLQAILPLAEFLSVFAVSQVSALESKFRMKKIDVEQEGLWPTSEHVEKARRELHNRIMDDELGSLRREAVDGLMALLRVDRETFRTLWIQPLVAAGATLDMALACIAQSEFQPN